MGSKASVNFIEIVTSDEPIDKLKALIDMDIDGLRCVTSALRPTVGLERDYIEGILRPMAARFSDYLAALRFLEDTAPAARMR